MQQKKTSTVFKCNTHCVPGKAGDYEVSLFELVV